jgi:hypothetical protein
VSDKNDIIFIAVICLFENKYRKPIFIKIFIVQNKKTKIRIFIIKITF